MSWLFLGYILSSVIIELGLLALTIVVAYTGRGRRRLLALVPAVTMAAMALYVAAGGVLLLAAWLGAAVVALVPPAQWAVRAAPATP